MKAQVTNLSKERIGGPTPGTPGARLLVTCAPPEDGSDSSLRSLAFTVPLTDENKVKYAFDNIIDVIV